MQTKEERWLVALGVAFTLVTSPIVACPPECVCAHKSVRCIFTNFTRIPSSVPSDTVTLDLRFNKISTLTQKSFPQMDHMQTLLLNNNEISNIEDGTFSHLPKLQSLFLYKNNLRRIRAHTFQGLEQLHHLYLHMNDIQSVDPSAFLSTPKLRSLYLNQNVIERLSPQLLDSLPNLERLRLDSNGFVCDCGMLPFTKPDAKIPNFLRLAGADCARPTNMRGKPLFQMTATDLHCSFPRIKASPRNLTVHHGETAIFECQADGDPRPEIRWFHNNVPVEEGGYGGVHVMQNGSLLIERPGATHSGFYQCLAVNPVGSRRTKRAQLRYVEESSAGQTNSVDLSPYPRQSPHFVALPRDEGANEGTSVRISCRATGNPRPYYEWQFEGRSVDRHSGAVEVSPNGDLVIRNLRRSHAGRYTCLALNSFGRVSASARIDVYYAPEMRFPPADVWVTEGSEVRLNCESEGNPPPVSLWLKSGSAIRSTRRINIEEQQMTIYPLLREDAGKYTCVATNPYGEARATAEIRLKRSMPPRIRTAPRAQQVKRGETAAFQCDAVGEPQPHITWLFNGSPVPTVRGHYDVTAQGTLYVNQATLQDSGHYTCQAANDVGAQTADATLTVTLDASRNPVDSALIQSSVEQARANVDRAINSTQRRLYSNTTKTPSELLAIFRYPGPQAVELARAREIYEETLDLLQQHVQRGLNFNISHFSYRSLLSASHLQLIAELTGCHIHRDSDPCQDMCFHQKYRTYDGTCNNFQHPMWGASLTPFRRLLAPMYENGFNTPVGWDETKLYYGHRKPNARLVSTQVISSSNAEVPQDGELTAMVMQWGQFIDHDIDFGVAAPSTAQFQTGRDCGNSCDRNEPPCFNIRLPPGDRRRGGRGCMEFERTGAVCGSGETSVLMSSVYPREQVNVVTSYMDASNVYGNNELDALDLRDLFSEHGLLKFDIVSHKRKPYLPFNRNTPMDCQRNASQPHPVRCFLAGDYRANEQLGLLSMHTIWLREHNRIASQLLTINPHWDGERIYQETRKIVGAMFQHITFQHWLPKVLGPAGMTRLGTYHGYQPSVDASTSNVFATAAFRFGHTLINPFLYRLNSSFQQIPEGHLQLHQAFFAPERLLNEGGVDPLLRGLFTSSAKRLTPEAMLNQELTERLFSAAHEVALDLASLNIQRGRDHALQGYLEWRRYCNLSAPNSWDDLAGDIQSRQLRRKLENLYGHPGNMDIWVGGLSETLVPGSRVGPLLFCLITDQFKRLRDGDRFWYESAESFSAVKLAEIRKVSLARALCDNGDDIQRVPRDVFQHQSHTDFVPCSDLPSINLHLWQECCASGCGNFYQYDVENEALGSGGDHPSSVRRKRATDESSNDRRLEDRLEAMEELVAALKQKIDDLTQENGTLKTRKDYGRRKGKDRPLCRPGTRRRRKGKRWRRDVCTTCQCRADELWCTVKAGCS